MIKQPTDNEIYLFETRLALYRLVKAIGTDKQQQRIDEADYILKKYSSPLDALRGQKEAMGWISADQDTSHDGEFLGCIEMTEECKAVHIRQRVISNRKNKWVLDEGERLLYWMPLPATPDKATASPVSDSIEQEKASEEVNLRWVKASERLPIPHNDIYFKVDGVMNLGFFNPARKEFYSGIGREHIEGIENIEWLEEYAASQSSEINHLKEENERLKKAIVQADKLAESAQHLFDMKNKKGSTNVLKNAWNILAGSLWDYKNLK